MSMTPVATKFDLRALATSQYLEQRKSHEQDEDREKKKRTMEALEAFKKWFDHTPDLVNGHFVETGDVRLSFIPSRWDSEYGTQHEGWCVVGNCKRCGEENFSPWCGDLSDIGKYLLDFQPDWGHSCERPTTVQEQKTPREILMDALDAYFQQLTDNR